MDVKPRQRLSRRSLDSTDALQTAYESSLPCSIKQPALLDIAQANLEGGFAASAIGYCLDVHDLALSKYVANREEDRIFIREPLRHGFVDAAVLAEKAPSLPVSPDQIESLLHVTMTGYLRVSAVPEAGATSIADPHGARLVAPASTFNAGRPGNLLGDDGGAAKRHLALTIAVVRAGTDDFAGSPAGGRTPFAIGIRLARQGHVAAGLVHAPPGTGTVEVKHASYTLGTAPCTVASWPKPQ